MNRGLNKLKAIHWHCGRTFPPWYPISMASPGEWSLSYCYKISNQNPGQCRRSSTTGLESVHKQNSPSTPGRSCKWAFQSVWQLGPGPKVTQAVVEGTSSAAAPPSLHLYYMPKQYERSEEWWNGMKETKQNKTCGWVTAEPNINQMTKCVFYVTFPHVKSKRHRFLYSSWYVWIKFVQKDGRLPMASLIFIQSILYNTLTWLLIFLHTCAWWKFPEISLVCAIRVLFLTSFSHTFI